MTVIEITAPRDVLVERLSGRRVCPNCGTYNGIDVLRLEAKAKQKPE